MRTPTLQLGHCPAPEPPFPPPLAQSGARTAQPWRSRTPAPRRTSSTSPPAHWRVPGNPTLRRGRLFPVPNQDPPVKTFQGPQRKEEKPTNPWRAQKASEPQSKAAKSLSQSPQPPPASLSSPQHLRPPRGTGGREGTRRGSQQLSLRGCRPALRSSASSSRSSASLPSAYASAASPSTTRASTGWPSCTATARPTETSSGPATCC
ncbi:calcineurin binding protein 1 [Phyllostomus discolor]|uniref:Calcineurin binding protein 1 n=1 Tax=Phyllostomus discolor TaxID=89673 RepID=A0A834DI05_9CHIR|nr:calcineurin binding protein 1 [Phyllostomus discolor]